MIFRNQFRNHSPHNPNQTQDQTHFHLTLTHLQNHVIDLILQFVLLRFLEIIWDFPTFLLSHTKNNLLRRSTKQYSFHMHMINFSDEMYRTHPKQHIEVTSYLLQYDILEITELNPLHNENFLKLFFQTNHMILKMSRCQVEVSLILSLIRIVR